MIISASRRTDIPAYYADWFFYRLRQGYALVKNPFNGRQISRVSLERKDMDGIVFWTKNPIPMLDRLDALEGVPYYFQFTLNPYLEDIEPNLPQKSSLAQAFRSLSLKSGRLSVVWRYDPILFNDRYTPQFHIKAFKELAARLAPYTEKCTASFLDDYLKIRSALKREGVYFPSDALKEDIICSFADIAKSEGIYVDTCAEEGDFKRYGVRGAACVDAERLERLGASGLEHKKDASQRPSCNCVKSVDIGAYYTCMSGCVYCYAGNLKRGCIQADYRLETLAAPGRTAKP